MKGLRVLGLIIFSIVLIGTAFAGGQQDKAGTALAGAPAPFDGSKQVHIALVRQMVEGEFMQMWRAGAEDQAELMGIKLTVFGKNMDNKAQADFIYQAISMGVDGIIIDHGLTETMMKPAEDALAAGIPVIAFDVALNNPMIPQIAQDDHALGRMALEQMVEDFNGKANVGYVYVAGILPLDKRDESFTAIKAENPGVIEIVRTGTLESPFSVKNADQVSASLRANPEINAYFSPYDEFAKGVVMALEEMDRTDILVYSADISTQDIELMTTPGNPWRATACTNPRVIGAASVRGIAMLIAGEKLPADILITPTLITNEMLVAANIANMNDLIESIPAFSESDACLTDWIPMK
ncbi:MAG: sugar ABC transporter substrate-binding protein [Spirochaetales bacterium]|nr:sugar ABC transporter substrate-binding protein [Spirochaetales bacterium]